MFSKSPHKIILICLMACMAHIPAAAVYRRGGSWIMADDASNELVRNLLLQSEEQAQNIDYAGAAQSLKHIIDLASTNAEVQAELDNETADGPVMLHVIVARADYLSHASGRRDYTVVKECRQALSNYSERAAGKRWEAYKRLYLAESFCFADENPHTNRVNNFKDLFLYDPLDPESCFTALHSHKWPTNELRWVLDTYYANGGKKDEKALFMEMKYATRCNEDALKRAAEYLEHSTNPGTDKLRELFTEVGYVIESQSRERLLKYRDALTNTALRYSPEKYNIQAIGFIMDERNKVDEILSIQRSSQ